MYLSKEQEKILVGEYGAALAKFMSILVKIGDVYGADRLIPVSSVQLAGVSYLTVGDAIFALSNLFEKDIPKVKVPTWLNPCGMDIHMWKEMNISEKFANKQLKILQFYEKIGVDFTLTCTPYLIGFRPAFGSHLAWSESSAVVMANSFFGARTNREGAPSALASALIGLTPRYGLHLTPNRRPKVRVDVKTGLEEIEDYSILGYWYGEEFGGKIPLFTNIKSLSLTSAKALGASIAATGSVPLYHVENITPESESISKTDFEETIVFSDKDKQEIRERFHYNGSEIDLIAVGCPHSSLKELSLILSHLSKYGLKDNISFWIFVARRLKNSDYGHAIINKLNKLGVSVFSDTCMVVSPAVRKQFKNIVTNSLKALFYLKQNTTATVYFAPLKDILQILTGG